MTTSNEISGTDYVGSAIEKSIQNIDPFERLETIVRNNFDKGLIDLETFEKALEELDIVKKR